MATNTVTRAGRASRPAERYRSTETKPFFATSEFLVLVVMTVALFIASTVVDDVDSRLAWILGTALVGSYILSRGIAKAASRSPAYDPREGLLREEISDGGRATVRD